MEKALLKTVLFLSFAFAACSWSSGNDDGGIPDGQEQDGVTDGDGGSDSGDGSSVRHLTASVMLGEGGFFGVSGVVVDDVSGNSPGAYAIGAHYADISGGEGDPIPAGRLYFFGGESFPTDFAENHLVLEPPDGSPGGGFGWALSGPCDFDGDGYADLPVGNHLYSNPGAPNSGRVVVFRGDAQGLSVDRYSYHTLSADLIRQSDSMGQTVLCADFDGDGYDDLLATGQNAGASDTGLGAIFYGSESGLPEHQDEVLEPRLAENKQYLGAASVYADLDGDGQKDLAIGGWGLIKGLTADGPHTGGVCIYKGGEDWSQGPAWELLPEEDAEIQMGAEMILFESDACKYLAVGAPSYGDPVSGAVLVYQVGVSGFQNQAPVVILLPEEGTGDVGFGESLAWIPDYGGAGEGALLAGMKYGDASESETGTGVVAVYQNDPDGQGFLSEAGLLAAPQPASGDGFGGTIVDLGDVNGDGLSDFWVGIAEHLEGDIYTGTQTGGVVFFH